MCFYISSIKNAADIAKSYDKVILNNDYYEEIMQEYRISAFCDPLCWIVTHEPDLKQMFWGLIPCWIQAKNGSPQARKAAVLRAEKIRKRTYNARAETIWEKQSFRTPILNQRCVIPVTGFFEFHHPTKNTTVPYYIFPTQNDFFSVGGIWDSWLDPETGELLFTFSIITTDANPLLKAIHNGGKNPCRQPLLLKAEDEKNWLSPDLPKDGIEKLLRPLNESFMEAYPIGKDFLIKDKSDSTILNEVFY